MESNVILQNITIVICTHNRSDLLLQTIHSINHAHCLTDINLSLLVIANACSDDTLHKLQLYKEKNILPPIYFEEEPIPGKSHALIRAVNLINEGYICFIDDDHRVDKHYFCTVINAIKSQPDISIFCGQIIPDWTSQEPEWIHDQGQYKIYPLPIPHFELGTQPMLVKHGVKLPGGGNLIVNRNVFNQVGHFSTELGPKGHNLSGSEDSDFILRVLKANLTIQYVPGIIQYHYVDEERLKFNYLVRKSFQRTRSLTKTKHPNSQPVPLYLWRKLFSYTGHFLFSLNLQKTRFYAMRIASTLGEIVGLRESINK
ncbi:MAG: glycosyltransferase [Methylomarinum sp.]|nr:glycosyltransferase [Methylomarinum sp.]